MLNRMSNTFANNKHTTTIISQTRANKEDLLYVIFPPIILSIGVVKKLDSIVGIPMKNIPRTMPPVTEDSPLKSVVFNALAPTTAAKANEKKTLICQFGDLNMYLDKSERFR